MYISKHFKAEEYLPFGVEDMGQVDGRILEVADTIRDLVGLQITINSNGRQYCGWRPKDCPIGAPKSMHKLGKALDLHCAGMTAEDMRTLILKACEQGAMPNLGRMEAGVSWCHIDLGGRVNGKVYLFHV